jgi:hypothetical protein
MKVFATEHIEYLCSDKRVRRMEPVRETLLFERRGDVFPTSAFFGSLKGAVSGGARTFDQSPAGLKTQAIVPTAILGDLGEDASNLVTEMEVLAQLPSCHNMTDLKSPKFHFDTTYQNIQIHHWIKVDRPFIVGFSG